MARSPTVRQPVSRPQPPLAVHLLWQTAPDAGTATDDLVRRIFGHLCADPVRPTQRGLGLPVRLWTSQAADAGLVAPPPAEIDLSWASRNLVVLLIDDALVSAGWDNYLDRLRDRIGQAAGNWLLPLSMTPYAAHLRLTDTLDVIDLPEEPDLRGQVAVNRIVHRAYRQMSNSRKPLRVFVSHAVRDGRDIAHAFCSHLNLHTDLQHFISQRDISGGDVFADIIVDAAADGAMLAVHTDAYASRPWCRREVLEAKRHQLPLAVLDAVTEGSPRLFPYLGNAPAVRWQPQSPITMERTVGALLDGALRRTYFPIRARQICAAHHVPPPAALCAAPPELLTALLHQYRDPAGGEAELPSAAAAPATRRRLLYPDPPLGTEETLLLHTLVPGCEPITLTALIAAGG